MAKVQEEEEEEEEKEEEEEEEERQTFFPAAAAAAASSKLNLSTSLSWYSLQLDGWIDSLLPSYVVADANEQLAANLTG